MCYAQPVSLVVDCARHVFGLLSPQLGAFGLVNKCLRPLSLWAQCRRRLPLLRIGLRANIVGVILC